MKILENNEYMMLNSIIYKIHTKKNFFEMRKELLEQIKMIISFDSADFYLSKGDGSTKLVSQVTYNCNRDNSGEYENLDYSQGILSSGKSLVYRESDIISDEKRTETEYYKKVYKPNNWHYSLQLIMGYEEEFMGVITFYREKGKKDFSYADIFVMDMIKDHISYRIHTEKEKFSKNGYKLTIDEATKEFSLTRRENTILSMIMKGLNNDEICEQAVISNNTLKKHLLNIYKKVGVKSKVQLFKKILEN